jgi:hypothetical protein
VLLLLVENKNSKFPGTEKTHDPYILAEAELKKSLNLSIFVLEVAWILEELWHLAHIPLLRKRAVEKIINSKGSHQKKSQSLDIVPTSAAPPPPLPNLGRLIW